MSEPIHLGTGVLTWYPQERRSDRYGAVWLMQDGYTSLSRREPEPTLDVAAAASAVGMTGRLTATVIEPRTSTHIGDLFRHIFPITPARWEEIDFGEGELFLDAGGDFGPAVGLRPDDGRSADWLNPYSLYRAHEQLIRLRFIPRTTPHG